VKMTPRNIAIIIVAVIVGVYLGLKFPLFGLLCLVGGLGFAVFVLMSNKQGTLVDATARAAAQTGVPAEGKARIYVMRKGFMAGMQGMDITVDDTHKGQIRSGYFMMAEVDPGTHHLTARFSKQTESTRQSHDVTLAAGQIVLFDMTFDMGMVQGTIRFDEAHDAGHIRQKIANLKMVNWLQG